MPREDDVNRMKCNNLNEDWPNIIFVKLIDIILVQVVINEGPYERLGIFVDIPFEDQL